MDKKPRAGPGASKASAAEVPCTSGGAGEPGNRKPAWDVALKLLGGRDKSRAQLEAALVQRGYTVGEVRDAVKRATELKYLDDDRASADLARKLFAQGRSRTDVARRLEAKGFDPAAADALPIDEAAAARALMKSKGVSGVKAARLLLARGFEEDLVSSLVELPEPTE